MLLFRTCKLGACCRRLPCCVLPLLVAFFGTLTQFLPKSLLASQKQKTEDEEDLLEFDISFADLDPNSPVGCTAIFFVRMFNPLLLHPGALKTISYTPLPSRLRPSLGRETGIANDAGKDKFWDFLQQLHDSDQLSRPSLIIHMGNLSARITSTDIEEFNRHIGKAVFLMIFLRMTTAPPTIFI